MTTSDLERAFETVWKQLGGVELTSEFRFHPTRKWRFDFVIPEKKIAIELEGGIWQGGRHNRAKGYTDDCEKYNEATRLGWKVFRFTSIMLDDPIRYIEPIMLGREANCCPACDKIISLGESGRDDRIPF